jgi:hypothetical protein
MASNMTRGDLRGSRISSTTATSPSLDNNGIATLPIRFIAGMSRDELIEVIRAAQMPLIDARTLRRLPFMERPALERLAHLARRCCRTRRRGCVEARELEAGAHASARSETDSFWEDL